MSWRFSLCFLGLVLGTTARQRESTQVMKGIYTRLAPTSLRSNSSFGTKLALRFANKPEIHSPKCTRSQPKMIPSQSTSIPNGYLFFERISRGIIQIRTTPHKPMVSDVIWCSSGACRPKASCRDYLCTICTKAEHRESDTTPSQK